MNIQRNETIQVKKNSDIVLNILCAMMLCGMFGGILIAFAACFKNSYSPGLNLFGLGMLVGALTPNIILKVF